MSDPYLVRQALRGVDTVVHLAATIRDQPPHRIEELNGLATRAPAAGGRAQRRAALRLLQRAQRLGGPAHAILPRQVAGRAGGRLLGSLETTIFAPSIVYDRSDPWVTLLRRFSFLPVLPVSGDGPGPLRADLGGRRGPLRRRRAGARRTGAATSWPAPRPSATTRCPTWSAASPDGRGRSIHVPLPLVRAGLIAMRSLFGEAVFATWEEAELMEVPMLSTRGTADAEELGVEPRRMGDVLEEATRQAAVLALALAATLRRQARALTLVPPKPDVLFGVSDQGDYRSSSTNSPPCSPSTRRCWRPSTRGATASTQPMNAGGKPATRPVLAISTDDDQTLSELITPEQIALGDGRRLPAAAQRLLRQTRTARLHPAAGRAQPLPQRLVGIQLRRHPEGRRTHRRLVQAGLPPHRHDRPRRADAGRDQRDPGRNRPAAGQPHQRAATRPACRRRR